MKVILGTGQVGLAILKTLLKNNPSEPVTLVNRTGKLNKALPAHVQLLAADVTDRHKMEYIAREADIIFSCTDVPYALWENFYPAAASALAYALSRTDARLVFADNFYSYGNVSGAIMNENFAHEAKTKKGKIRTAVIKQLLFSGDPFNSRVAFVKAADFIGPTIHKGLFGKDFLDRLHSGKSIFLFGEPTLPHTFTYIHDFATALINVGNAPDAFGKIWHAPNAAPISPEAWTLLFEKKAGKPAKIKILPKFVIRFVGLFNSLVRELYELAYQFEFPYLVDHSAYTKRFGDHATSTTQIVEETLSWYRNASNAKNN